MQLTAYFDFSSLSVADVPFVGVAFPSNATVGSWFVVDRVEFVARPRPAPVWTKLANSALYGGRFSVQVPVKTGITGVTVVRSLARYNSGWTTCRCAPACGCWVACVCAHVLLGVSPWGGE